jgi:hypothetical protein
MKNNAMNNLPNMNNSKPLELNSGLQFRFAYQALADKFGHDMVGTMLEIVQQFDTPKCVVLEKLLGIYQRPEEAGAEYLWHTGKSLVGKVEDFNEFTAQLLVAFEVPITETRYFADEEDAGGLSYNEWYNLSERERLGYARQEVPTGKHRSSSQWVEIDQLGTRYCDWRLLTLDELIAGELSEDNRAATENNQHNQSNPPASAGEYVMAG